MNNIYLASGSPQRKEILRELDIDFDVIPAETQEVSSADAEKTVKINAKHKAIAGLEYIRISHKANGLIIAADTVVQAKNQVLGKPLDQDDAIKTLKMLSANQIAALSGVCVINSSTGDGWLGFDTTLAKMKSMTDEEIMLYVASGEPLTRAGSIGISRYGEIFVESIFGSYSGFAGLPKHLLLHLLKAADPTMQRPITQKVPTIEHFKVN